MEDLLINDLLDPNTRENALCELSKSRESINNLAIKLWNQVGINYFIEGIAAVLLLEIVSVYPMLSPPTLNSQTSSRVCNVLALLQCIASHEETKKSFLQGTYTL